MDTVTVNVVDLPQQVTVNVTETVNSVQVTISEGGDGNVFSVNGMVGVVVIGINDIAGLSSDISIASSQNLSQSVLISTAQSTADAGGGGGTIDSSARSMATSVAVVEAGDFSTTSSQNISQSVLISVATTGASAADSKAVSVALLESSDISITSSQNVSQSVLISVAQSTADAAGGGGSGTFNKVTTNNSNLTVSGDGTDTVNVTLADDPIMAGSIGVGEISVSRLKSGTTPIFGANGFYLMGADGVENLEVSKGGVVGFFGSEAFFAMGDRGDGGVTAGTAMGFYINHKVYNVYSNTAGVNSLSVAANGDVAVGANGYGTYSSDGSTSNIPAGFYVDRSSSWFTGTIKAPSLTSALGINMVQQDSNGVLTVQTLASDPRIKNILTSLPIYGLKEVLKLVKSGGLITFRFKEKVAADYTKVFNGFNAKAVQEIMPLAVQVADDEDKTLVLNDASIKSLLNTSFAAIAELSEENKKIKKSLRRMNWVFGVCVIGVVLAMIFK